MLDRVERPFVESCGSPNRGRLKSRTQLHPHFLFNALHTVVQLIPADPARANEAAELVADLLRTTLEEQRDEVTLGDEWRFVSRYLAVEQMTLPSHFSSASGLGMGLLNQLWSFLREPFLLRGPDYHHFRRIIIPTLRGTTEIDHLID